MSAIYFFGTPTWDFPGQLDVLNQHIKHQRDRDLFGHISSSCWTYDTNISIFPQQIHLILIEWKCPKNPLLYWWIDLFTKKWPSLNILIMPQGLCFIPVSGSCDDMVLLFLMMSLQGVTSQFLHSLKSYYIMPYKGIKIMENKIDVLMMLWNVSHTLRAILDWEMFLCNMYHFLFLVHKNLLMVI